jgi:hypothetical protein
VPPGDGVAAYARRRYRAPMRTQLSVGRVAVAMAAVLMAAPSFAQEKTAGTSSAKPAAAGESGTLPAIKSVAFSERGYYRVNGEPFFPILLYDAPGDPATLKTLADFGFNTLTNLKPDEWAGLPAQGFYVASHVPEDGKLGAGALGGLLMAIGTDSPALNLGADMLTKVKAENAKLRAATQGRPVMFAIGYWENEPEGVKAGKIPAKEKYDDLVAAIDVPAPYLYPVPYQPVTSVGEAVARARHAGGGKKPVLPILQLFVWDAKDRYPTPAELRCMVYLSLIEGAGGIGYYSYGSVSGKPSTTIAQAQPELWQSLKGLNAEVAQIGRVLAVGKDDPTVTATASKPPEVRLRAVADQNRGLLLVVNTSDAPKSVEVKLPASAGANVKSLAAGGPAIPVQGGVAKITLKPFDGAAIEYTAEAK